MDKSWKQEERNAGSLLNGQRYPANSGGRVDVEGPYFFPQVKHVQRLSLAQLEALAVEMADLGQQRAKDGVVVVKRKAGQGKPTPRLVIMTDEVFERVLKVQRVLGGVGHETVGT